jgi:GDP-mannose pyrophosphatase NudK
VVEKITFFNCAYSAADKMSECGGLADEGGVMKNLLQQDAAIVAAGDIIDAKTVVLIQFLRSRIRAKPRV